MEFFEIVRSRRSIRRFLDDPVPRDVLDSIVTAGAESPSGCNLHGKQFIIVDDPAVMEQLRPMSPALGSAPAAIVLCTEAKGTAYGEFWMQDASAAMENMLLAAVALGYGACWVEGQVRGREPELRKLLAVPPELRVWSLTPVGRPAEAGKRPPKPEPADITHYNAFGQRG